jgi:hypothetical protein
VRVNKQKIDHATYTWILEPGCVSMKLGQCADGDRFIDKYPREKPFESPPRMPAGGRVAKTPSPKPRRSRSSSDSSSSSSNSSL